MIDMKKLYGIGVLLLLVGCGGQIYSLYLNWILLNIGSKISSITSIGLTFIFMLIFLDVYRNMPKTNQSLTISDKDLEKLQKLQEKYKK
jgi:hypothetical protein